MTPSSNVNPAVNLINSLNSTNSSLAGSSTATSGSASSISGTGLQNSFMTLLTTQLQNQDPLNPMDSGQMTSQLAQISTVDGINQLNATLQALSTSMSSSQSLSSATSLIGHGVLVPGSTIALASGSSANGGVQLSQAADVVTVNITDSSGHVVRTISLGAQKAGVVPFTWDGLTNSGSKAPAGAYNVSASASMSGQPVTASTLSYGPVTSVTLGAQGPSLNITGLGAAALSSVVMVQ